MGGWDGVVGGWAVQTVTRTIQLKLSLVEVELGCVNTNNNKLG
jgi:hypothetical protein